MNKPHILFALVLCTAAACLKSEEPKGPNATATATDTPDALDNIVKSSSHMSQGLRPICDKFMERSTRIREISEKSATLDATLRADLKFLSEGFRSLANFGNACITVEKILSKTSEPATANVEAAAHYRRYLTEVKRFQAELQRSSETHAALKDIGSDNYIPALVDILNARAARLVKAPIKE
jgi:Skp family chaperone for outer membrane proteins